MPPHPPALGEFCTTRLATAAASHAKSRSKDDEPRKISYSTGHVQPLHGRRAVAERLYAPAPRGVAGVSAMLMESAVVAGVVLGTN